MRVGHVQGGGWYRGKLHLLTSPQPFPLPSALFCDGPRSMDYLNEMEVRRREELERDLSGSEEELLSDEDFDGERVTAEERRTHELGHLGRFHKDPFEQSAAFCAIMS